MTDREVKSFRADDGSLHINQELAIERDIASYLIRICGDKDPHDPNYICTA